MRLPRMSELAQAVAANLAPHITALEVSSASCRPGFINHLLFRDGVTTQWACCLRGLCRRSYRRPDGLAMVKSISRTRASPASVHRARHGPPPRSKARIQIGAFLGLRLSQ